MATPVDARNAIKTKIETDYPKFVSEVNLAIDKLAQGEIMVELSLPKHERVNKEEISVMVATWYVSSLGFVPGMSIDKNLSIEVSPE